MTLCGRNAENSNQGESVAGVREGEKEEEEVQDGGHFEVKDASADGAGDAVHPELAIPHFRIIWNTIYTPIK